MYGSKGRKLEESATNLDICVLAVHDPDNFTPKFGFIKMVNCQGCLLRFCHLN